uniref:Uncharacterized protein n=1 Tax=Arundo donax TaxID=35708 RepID=A0A0A9H0M3_ARUDO
MHLSTSPRRSLTRTASVERSRRQGRSLTGCLTRTLCLGTP